jgi:hypothetical protein
MMDQCTPPVPGSYGIPAQAGSSPGHIQGFPQKDEAGRALEVELKPSTAYELVMDSKSSQEWEAAVIEETTGLWIKQIELGGGNRRSELFRTVAAKRVRILVRALTHKSADPLYVSSISIREIGEL